jgi:cell fate (sporulation/competence/biofilm development) regulator YlbF (YheA/YmcA/DUF963 family)
MLNKIIYLEGGKMSNIYDRSHELARALSTSVEYRQYEEARKKLESNKENLKMLQHFRMKQLELQQAQVMGQNPEAKLKQLEQMYQVLCLKPEINEFLQVEMRFSKMMMDVQKIIGQSVGFEYDFPEAKK